MKQAKEERIKQQLEEAKKNAKPDITSVSRALTQSKDENVVERLYEYKKMYDEKQQERKEKLLEAVQALRI